MFSDSVSDAHVGCCSPSCLRMRGAVYALPVLVLVVCRIRSGQLSVAIRLLSLSAAPAGVLSNHTIHHTPHAHSPRNIRTPHTPHTTHTTLTPHTTRHSFLRIRKSGMVCSWWHIWDALRCLIKFNKSIQCCAILLKLKPVIQNPTHTNTPTKTRTKTRTRYAAYRYTPSQLYIQIHVSTYATAYAHKERPQIHLRLKYCLIRPCYHVTW